MRPLMTVDMAVAMNRVRLVRYAAEDTDVFVYVPANHINDLANDLKHWCSVGRPRGPHPGKLVLMDGEPDALGIKLPGPTYEDYLAQAIDLMVLRS